ncbi:hypothetical protein OB2597_10881 [Pseudooceanicola batsensis HTCC2597]|uniref:Uncharacterized protein n=1 Tax=Pseudooceanicola batsensis (strain ATCC BAA-863 / DSM 15984 / KCTC 12145 / HTCC2597) TaxID=252305 RepID=A3TVU6_PSEBH|nr:hypothetical protein [Pseudooceanicola batsensis]EAQ03742.1 hypothetical protein OB2597_10881 [Pseudooceanicola batsensis HTCC2597]
MPISDRTEAGRRARALPALLGGLAMLLLAACDETGAPGLFGPPAASALEAVAFDDGEIVVQGPAGFCIDRTSLRVRGERHFALVAQCDLLRRDAIAGISSLSFLTVTVVRTTPDAQLPTGGQIASTFGPATLLYDSMIDGIRVVQLSRGGETATKQADPVHWRGVMHLKGHAVGLAAYSMQDGSGAGREGRDLLLALARNIRSASE